jgi:hypothetical protein
MSKKTSKGFGKSSNSIHNYKKPVLKPEQDSSQLHEIYEQFIAEPTTEAEILENECEEVEIMSVKNAKMSKQELQKLNSYITKSSSRSEEISDKLVDDVPFTKSLTNFNTTLKSEVNSESVIFESGLADITIDKLAIEPRKKPGFHTIIMLLLTNFV